MTQMKLVFHVSPGYAERLLPALGGILTDFVCILSGRDFENLGYALDDLSEGGRLFSFATEMNKDCSFLVTFNFVDSIDGNGERYLFEAMGDFEADLVPQN